MHHLLRSLNEFRESLVSQFMICKLSANSDSVSRLGSMIPIQTLALVVTCIHMSGLPDYCRSKEYYVQKLD